MNLLRVGPVFGGVGNGLEFPWGRVVADAQADARSLEVAAQNLLLLGRGAFVHAVQAGVLALQDEIGAAHVGGQHGFFNQLVRIVAGARDDFLDAAALVTDDLSLYCFKIDRAALVA